MNSCNFIGSLGKDGELRFLNDGTPLLQFSIAVNSGYGDKQVTTWINCNFFGKRAESVEIYVRKGQRIGVSGELSMRKWEKDGAERQSLELRVNDLTLLGNKDGQQQEDSKPQTQESREFTPPAQKKPGNFDDFDDDIPFMNPYKFNWRVV